MNLVYIDVKSSPCVVAVYEGKKRIAGGKLNMVPYPDDIEAMRIAPKSFFADLEVQEDDAKVSQS